MHIVLFNPYFTQESPEKSFYRQDVPNDIDSIVDFSHTAVYVNTCLAIATGEEPWQRCPCVRESHAFLMQFHCFF